MRKRIAIALLLVVVATGVGVAASAGFSFLFALPGSGELTVRNSQKNSVWRPCALSVICPSSASRTVTVYKVAGALEYAIARAAGEAQVYVYEFETDYWCSLSNGVKVVVVPACTGLVEVVYE